MSQESLFPVPPRAHARRTDPETSHWAAASVDVTTTQSYVLTALRMGGPMSDEEIGDYIRKTWPEVKMTEQSVRSRRSELVGKGLVEFAGEFTKTRNGGKTRIWRGR